MDAVLSLSRLQFAANISFHILFPSISIALGWFLLFFKMRHNATGDPKWGDAYAFWVKIFALTFALGAVSGITMSFQFGTNWPGYMKTVGNIAGPLLAYEVMSAFFLEATFLGVMLFGGARVSSRVHALSCFLVAFGTTLSAFWIMALNSWMQTPAGFEMRGGKAYATDWWAIVFNPSMPYRLSHMLLASFATASFLVAGVSAYRRLKGDRGAEVAMTLRAAIVSAAVFSVAQIAVGDMHGLNTLKHQPAKVAAMEGLWEDRQGVPMVLFAIPDESSRENLFEVAIPRAASLILTHDIDGFVQGIASFGENHPKVAPVFFAFRAMVGMGMLMAGLSWLGLFLGRKGIASLPRKYLLALAAMSFSGWVATLAGWYVAEIGRQPYLVYGMLTTAQAATQTASSAMVASTLAMYLALYAGLASAYVWTVFYLARQAAAKGAPPAAAVLALAAPAADGSSVFAPMSAFGAGDPSPAEVSP